MKKLTLIGSLLLFTLVSGCEDTDTAKQSGFDINGKEASCVPMGEKACTEVYTNEERFADKCRGEGHVVVRCDCHKYLCDTKDGKPLSFEQ